MSTVQPDPRPVTTSRAVTVAPDVVAGLVNDGSAYAVARAAAREAVRRGSRVKFVQVTATGISSKEREDVERSTFRAALSALKGLQRVPCTFEVVDGEPGAALVERSADASLLVVGRDAGADDRNVARHCQAYARCDVLTIATDRPTAALIEISAPSRASEAADISISAGLVTEV